MNLLHETTNLIKVSGHKIEDIVFIGSESSGHQCTWEKFIVLADKEYSDMAGSQKVATDLIIVFSDGVKMWRDEYDGDECWEFSTPFKQPSDNKPINRLFTKGVGWDTLAEINS